MCVCARNTIQITFAWTDQNVNESINKIYVFSIVLCVVGDDMNVCECVCFCNENKTTTSLQLQNASNDDNSFVFSVVVSRKNICICRYRCRWCIYNIISKTIIMYKLFKQDMMFLNCIYICVCSCMWSRLREMWNNNIGCNKWIEWWEGGQFRPQFSTRKFLKGAKILLFEHQIQ